MGVDDGLEYRGGEACLPPRTCLFRPWGQAPREGGLVEDGVYVGGFVSLRALGRRSAHPWGAAPRELECRDVPWSA